MPKVSETFGGAYLKADHLNGQPRVVTIDGYNIERIFGDEKFVAYFVDEKRGLALSAACARDIAQVLGDEMEEWAGRSVELYSEQRTITDRDTQTDKLITMIRARAPSSGSPTTTLAPPPTTATAKRRPGFDDDIPF
jgi:hypothetical protein